MLMDKVDQDLEFALWEEGHMKVEDVANYEEVRAAILEKVSAAAGCRLQGPGLRVED